MARKRSLISLDTFYRFMSENGWNVLQNDEDTFLFNKKNKQIVAKVDTLSRNYYITRFDVWIDHRLVDTLDVYLDTPDEEIINFIRKYNRGIKSSANRVYENIIHRFFREDFEDCKNVNDVIDFLEDHGYPVDGDTYGAARWLWDDLNS